MKRICIVRRKYYPWQKNVRRDAEALVKAGYQVDVICTGHKAQKPFEVLNGVHIYRTITPYNRDNSLLVLYDYITFFILSFLKLTWFDLRKHYAVIEINTMPDFLVFITVICRLLGSKVILYMFEDMPGLFMSSYKVGPQNIGARILRFFEKWSATYADHVIVSDGLHYKHHLENRGLPPSKITVILNVPDTGVFQSIPPPALNAKHPFRIVIVSTLVKRYGVQTVIKAIPFAVKHIPDLIVDIVGDGEYRPYLQEIARELQIDKHVHFWGWVEHDNIPGIIARADLGLAPMSDDVGLPNKLFEYFALGKPAIVSAQPSLISAFDHNGTVAFFEPDNEVDLADHIVYLFRNPEKRKSLVSHGYEFYNTCRWEITQKEYLKVYEELLKP